MKKEKKMLKQWPKMQPVSNKNDVNKMDTRTEHCKCKAKFAGAKKVASPMTWIARPQSQQE